MNSTVAIVKLTRPLNCFIASAAVWVGAYLTLSPVDLWPVFVASACAFLIGAAGNVHNDICDIEIDRVAHPNRVLPSGALSIETAGRLAIVLVLAAVGLSSLLGLKLFVVLLSVLAVLYAYNRWLKWVPLVGNLAVAGVAAATFIVGGLASEPNEVFDLPGSLIPALFGFLIHLMRELTKDVLDMEGDKMAGHRTLPLLIGLRPTLGLVIAVGLVLAWSLYQPYTQEWYGSRYWVLAWAGVLPLSLGMSFVTLAWPKRSTVNALAVSLKLSMLVGLVALYVA